jgi:hydrogenase nickel incorporation protein HypA/HybF
MAILSFKMHELAMAQAILDEAQQQVEAHRAHKVLVIRLQVGELSTAMPEALTFSFEVISKDTCAQDAKLDITRVPWRIRCSSCHKEYRVHDCLALCPECNSAGGETISGKELMITEMEVE